VQVAKEIRLTEMLTFMRSSLPIAATPPPAAPASSPLLVRCFMMSCLTSSKHMRIRLSSSVRLCSAFKCSLRTSRRFLRSASSSRRSRRTTSLYLFERCYKAPARQQQRRWCTYLAMLSPGPASAAVGAGAGPGDVFNVDFREDSAAFSTSLCRREFSFFSATICRTRNSRSSSWHLALVFRRRFSFDSC
jgi:hypothetical protein